MAEAQALLQSLSEDYQKLQQDLQNHVAARQKLEGQKQENLGVQQEFDKLGDGETIYKLVGPVLLKQDKIEAESTVKARDWRRKSQRRRRSLKIKRQRLFKYRQARKGRELAKATSRLNEFG